MFRLLLLLISLSVTANALPPDSALGTDNQGRWLFVISADGDIPNHDRLSCVISTDDGQSWAAYPAPDAEAVEIRYPRIAADSKGNWLLSWIQKDTSGSESIVCATLSHGQESWSKTNVIHEFAEELVARELQARATGAGSWEVSSVLSSPFMDYGRAWFFLASGGGESWQCSRSRLPIELVDSGQLLSVAWVPSENDRWFVGSVARPIVCGWNDLKFRSSIYDRSSSLWTTPKMLRIGEDEVTITNVFSLTRAANGQILLICGPNDSREWLCSYLFSNTLTGDRVITKPTSLANMIVPAASMGVPWFVDSCPDPTTLCVFESIDDGTTWEQLLCFEKRDVTINPSTSVSDGVSGWLFAAERVDNEGNPWLRIIVMRRPGNAVEWEMSEPNLCPPEPTQRPCVLLHLERSDNGSCIIVFCTGPMLGENSQTFSVRSTDFGETWSAPSGLPIR